MESQADGVLADSELVRRRLATVLKPAAIDPWLNAPNELLEGAAPLALIRAGGLPRVLALIEALAEGVFV